MTVRLSTCVRPLRRRRRRRWLPMEPSERQKRPPGMLAPRGLPWPSLIPLMMPRMLLSGSWIRLRIGSRTWSGILMPSSVRPSAPGRSLRTLLILVMKRSARSTRPSASWIVRWRSLKTRSVMLRISVANSRKVPKRSHLRRRRLGTLVRRSRALPTRRAWQLQRRSFLPLRASVTSCREISMS